MGYIGYRTYDIKYHTIWRILAAILIQQYSSMNSTYLPRSKAPSPISERVAYTYWYLHLYGCCCCSIRTCVCSSLNRPFFCMFLVLLYVWYNIIVRTYFVRSVFCRKRYTIGDAQTTNKRRLASSRNTDHIIDHRSQFDLLQIQHYDVPGTYS